MWIIKRFYDLVWKDGIGKLLSYVLIAPIRVYQWTISPMLGDVCRYYPSCSKYAVESLKVHGPFKGLFLTAYRLLRCTPFTRGGIDPTPERGRWPRSVKTDLE